MSTRVDRDYNVFRIRADAAVSPRTHHEHEFYTLESRHWVNVVPLTADREVVMIHQYRHGSRDVSLEIPGGLVDEAAQFGESRPRLVANQGEAGLDGGDDGVVAHELVLAVTPDGVPASDGYLFEGQQGIGGQLGIDPQEGLHVEGGVPDRVAALKEPREEPAVGQIVPVDRRVESMDAEAETGAERDDLAGGAAQVFLKGAQGRDDGFPVVDAGVKGKTLVVQVGLIGEMLACEAERDLVVDRSVDGLPDRHPVDVGPARDVEVLERLFDDREVVLPVFERHRSIEPVERDRVERLDPRVDPARGAVANAQGVAVAAKAQMLERQHPRLGADSR